MPKSKRAATEKSIMRTSWWRQSLLVFSLLMPITAQTADVESVPRFLTARSFAVGKNPVALAVHDFNRDGRLDLPVANQLSHTLSVLLGDGAGSFSPATEFAVGFSPSAVVVGDFNMPSVI